ncbi:hypothetical protein ABE504_20640 [Paenibacillus oryzisoli]
MIFSVIFITASPPTSLFTVYSHYKKGDPLHTVRNITGIVNIVSHACLTQPQQPFVVGWRFDARDGIQRDAVLPQASLRQRLPAETAQQRGRIRLARFEQRLQLRHRVPAVNAVQRMRRAADPRQDRICAVLQAALHQQRGFAGDQRHIAADCPNLGVPRERQRRVQAADDAAAGVVVRNNPYGTIQYGKKWCRMVGDNNQFTAHRPHPFKLPGDQGLPLKREQRLDLPVHPAALAAGQYDACEHSVRTSFHSGIAPLYLAHGGL